MRGTGAAMLKWVADKLSLKKDRLSLAEQIKEPVCLDGWFASQSAENLLSTPARKRALQQLWENSPFSRTVWDSFWLAPVKELAIRVQQLPAAPTGPYAHEGGMLDEALEVAVCAVRLSRGWMLPPGAPPEEQAAQSSAWCTAIFWAALLHDLESLGEMAAFYEDGRRWYPGLEAPDSPWRVRFCEPETKPEARAAAFACRLLPFEGLRWISRWPQLTDTLLVYLSGNKSGGSLLHAVVSEAREKCGIPVALTSRQLSEDVTHPIIQNASVELPKHQVIPPIVNPIVSEPDNHNTPQFLGTPETCSAGGLLVSAMGQSIQAGGQSDGPVYPLSDGGTPGELLSLLDHMMGGEPALPSATECVAEISILEPQPFVQEAPLSSGEQFWHWLVTSVGNGTLTLNTRDSLLHVMAQYVFIQTLDCFYRYLAGQGNSDTEKEGIQKSFETLGRHYYQKW